MEEKKDRILQFFASLFLLSFIGVIAGVITDFKYTWLSVISFLMILPAINMWIWQWAEAKKTKNLQTKF